MALPSCHCFPSEWTNETLPTDFQSKHLKFADLFRSPYWLVAHGRHEKARANLVKLHDADYNIDGHMAEIHDSLARINQENESQGSMAECFDRKNWKRTLVATSTFFIQNACGNSWVIGYMSCKNVHLCSHWRSGKRDRMTSIG